MSDSYTPCVWCEDSGRMEVVEQTEDGEDYDSTADCEWCDANSRACKGCSNPNCPGCGGKERIQAGEGGK